MKKEIIIYNNGIITKQNNFNNNYFYKLYMSFFLLTLIYYSYSKKFALKHFSISIQNKLYNNYINVAYAFDRNYHYITHCSMKSIMLSQNNNTFINFYILVSSKLNESHKLIINKISQQHENCKINYLYIDDKFNHFNPKAWSTADFYRLELPELLKNEKKVLYLDSDTIIYKDLSKIYNYAINNKYFIGMLDIIDPNLKIEIKNFINTGVILMNLEELRKENISQKIIEFLNKNISKIDFPINDSINIICNKKNGYFSPEYVQWGFCNNDFLDEYFRSLKINFNKEDIEKGYKDPYIYHLIGSWNKPWKGIPIYNKKMCIDPFTRFYEIARKTDYYTEILKEYEF